MSEHDEPAVTTAEHLLGGDGAPASLLDAVDGLLNRGVLLEGDLVLGLADVDLVYLRLSTLLAAADRVLKSGARAPAPAPNPAAPAPATPRSPAAAATAPPQPASARAGGDTASIDALRNRIEQTLGHDRSDAAAPTPTPPAPADGTRAQRWNAAPEDVERSVARLVLALVDFLRQLMERQAIRRMEQGTLSDTEVERLGQALMRLEQTVHTMARRFNLDPGDLTLDLGPLGPLT
jgi:hypothetical protein